MACSPFSIDMLSQYPRVIEALFMSTAPGLGEGWTDFRDNLEAYATASTDPLLDDSTPYKLLTDISEVTGSDDVIIEEVEFYAYDSTLPGSHVQDADTITEIYASLGQTKQYGVSRVKNGMIGGTWQPNFFRPRVYIDDTPLLLMDATDEISSSTGSSIRSHRSIGLPLPYCRQFYTRFNKVQRPRFYGHLCQIITGTGKIQQYPVMARMTFRLK